ncbi:trypsin-7-like [Chrysoperla carnea]|uniref:trypsin-7-like n=1 Tax=Chrysoperla carnea TaxID=189513 RepID=UPI001D09604D|nr:trypsin-7-like [Chrysoperla carnea]
MLRFCFLLIALAVPILGASLEGRVVGGEDADLGDVASIVSLRTSRGSHSCGGVLISKDYVLTAAHCAVSIPASIQFGVVTIDPKAKDGSVINISSKIIHEKYVTATSGNDIALLKLAEPAVFGKYAQPAVLPDQDEPAPAGSNVLLAGWGYNETGGILPKRLQKVNITIVDINECKKIHSYTVHDSNVCAGVPGGWKGQCNGDSGGPLTLNGKIVGLVSWSMKPCTTPPFPGVFTRVASFRDWIRKNAGV